MRQVLLLLLVSLGLSSAAAAAPHRTLSVTFMNIEWFGRNADEARTPKISKFFDDNNLWADVMVFEEIVDVNKLRDEVLEGKYKCQSYTNRDPRHQHVVLCYEKSLTLAIAADDDNYTLENVQMTTLRPAVHGILKDASGRRLLQIVGVHLKAMPDKSDVRRQQVQMIADYLDGRADQEPAIVVGDFNAYEDDSAVFADIFGDTLKSVTIREDYTFRDAQYRNKFDLAFVSPSLISGITERVAGPCNGGTTAQISKYNQDVSDHCPVNLTLRLPNR